MVARIPLLLAAADAVYAAGLGLLLGMLFTTVRMLLPKGAVFAFFCDFAILSLGGILYSSIAVARFYAGIARWYTIAALIIGYLAWQITAHSKFVYGARLLKFAVIFPFFALWEKVLRRPTAKFWQNIIQKAENRKKNKLKTNIKATKQLQKPSQVLYNSK